MLAFSTASSSVDAPGQHGGGARPARHSRTRSSSFVLPAGATLNKNGAAVYKAVTAVFLAQLYGFPLGRRHAAHDRARVDARGVRRRGRAGQLARDDAHRAQRDRARAACGGGHRARRRRRPSARHVPHGGEHVRQSGRRRVDRAQRGRACGGDDACRRRSARRSSRRSPGATRAPATSSSATSIS